MEFVYIYMSGIYAYIIYIYISGGFDPYSY